MSTGENGKGQTGRRWSEFIKSDVGRRIVIGIGVFGILLILLSEFFPKKAVDTIAQTAGVFSADEYIAALETKLTEVIGRIEGAGGCRVMVTLENGVEYVYASEEKFGNDYSSDGEKSSQTDNTESTVILIQTEDGYEGLLVTELQPTVKGVVVVCEGGQDEEVRQRVTEAVMTVLNITSKRVCVVAGNSGSE